MVATMKKRGAKAPVQPTTPSIKIGPPPDCIAEYVKQYQHLTNKELVELIVNCASIVVEQVHKAAAAVYIQATRGNDIRSILPGVLRWAGHVAYGKLLPEAAVVFSSRSMVTDLVACIPEASQKKLLVDKSMEVAVLTEKGHTARRVPLGQVTFKTARVVLAGGKVNTIEEQVVRLKEDEEFRRKSVELPSGVVVDQRRGLLICTKACQLTKAMLAEVVRILA